LLPDQDRQKQAETYTQLFDFISKEVGVSYDLIFPDSYQKLVEDFNQGNVDLAYFGGYTFLQAHEKSGAIPLVMRDIDRKFVSCVAVRKDSAIKNIEELKGTDFAFGSKLSTSGHIMPRHYFQKQKLVPEKYFSSVKYSGAHDKTLELIFQNKVKSGVLNAYIYEALVRNNNNYQSELEVIWQTPPYPDYVWAVQSNLSKAFNQRVLDAFLSISSHSIQGQKILESLSTEAFYPASISDFDTLIKAVSQMQGLGD